MRRPKAYLAGPLGFTESGRMFLDNTLVPLVEKAGFEPVNPWKLTPQALIDSASSLPYGEQKRKRWREINPVIAETNARAIHDADLIVAVLDGADVDSGTAAEIGYAAALGKRVIGYRSDFRLCADNQGSTINLQVEYFVRMNGGEIVTDSERLEQALKTSFPERRP